MYSRCGEDAFLAQCLGQFAFDLLIVLGLDGFGCAVPLDEPERPDQRSHVVARQAVRGRDQEKSWGEPADQVAPSHRQGSSLLM